MLKPLMIIALALSACGGVADPMAGRWSIHIPEPGYDIAMDLRAEGGVVTGTATLNGNVPVSVEGQTFDDTRGHRGLVILRFAGLTLEPFCEVIAADRLSGTVYVWGDGAPSYDFVATRP